MPMAHSLNVSLFFLRALIVQHMGAGAKGYFLRIYSLTPIAFLTHGHTFTNLIFLYVHTCQNHFQVVPLLNGRGRQ